MSGRLLVTGAAGSVGRAVCEELAHEDVVATDIDELDVTLPEQVWHVIRDTRPDRILHLAGAKHAPEGEVDPETCARINVVGTANVLRAAAAVGAKVVFASSCKACDPETVYGATKLIAERLVLNDSGVVVRYYNVPEADGNVFRLWEQLPETQPLPVADAWRFFLPMAQAVALTVGALEFRQGRYAVDPGPSRHMSEVATELYPGRRQKKIPLRRGDRYREPLHAQCESVVAETSGLMRIVGPYDPARMMVAA